MKPRYAITALTLGLLVVAGSAPTIGQSTDLAPTQLRVVWTTDPAHQAKVSWTTAAAGTSHVVHYDVVPRGGVLADYAFTVQVATSGEYEAGGPYFHHAELTDLLPESEVYFSVATDGEVSPELHFRTAPAAGSTKLLYGDGFG